MKRSDFLTAGILLLFTLNGCTTVKRFQSAAYKGEDNGLVEVELFNTRLSAEPVSVKEKNLWTLSANAQTRLVQILDERYPDNEQFISALSASYGPNELVAEEYTRKDLRMVFTLSKSRDYSMLNDPSGKFSPADRIEYFRLSLEIPDNYRLRFHQWNRYITEYGEIHIADVSFSRNLDLSLEGSPGGVGLESGASMGGTERQEVSRRFLKLNGSISDQRVVIEAEGTREVDLTGNVSADVSLQFDEFPEVVFIPVFVAGEEGNSILGDLKMLNVLVPAISGAPDTIFADLKLGYIYRHVDSGWKTFAEWDDRVEYYQGTVKKQVPLFLKRDYIPQFYCIGTDQGGIRTIKIQRDPEQEYLLQFRNYMEANEFLKWLERISPQQDEPFQMDGMMLLFDGKPLRGTRVPEHHFKIMPVY